MFKEFLLDAIKQIKGEAKTSSAKGVIVFTNGSLKKMKSWGLSENDIRDVVKNGEVIKENMISRKYNGYEIGIYYFKDAQSGNYVILSAWKRQRR